MTLWRIVVFFTTAVMAALPAAAGQPFSDYAAGWCAGYKVAAEASIRNRDHWRQLLELPTETHDQAIKRIYGSIDKYKYLMPPGTVSDKIMELMADSIDLYVVVPPIRVGDPDQVMILGNGETITCRAQGPKSHSERDSPRDEEGRDGR